MLYTFDETVKMIDSGQSLHIAGSEGLLRKLPKGNWIGGSTEYFLSEGGGCVSDTLLHINPLPYAEYQIKSYCAEAINQIAVDAYDNGFSIVIIPLGSAVHQVYATKAPVFTGMFIKNIVGWISGANLDKPEQKAIVVNGLTGEVFEDRAVVCHCALPVDKVVTIQMINIYQPDPDSVTIEFKTDGFEATTCLIDGVEWNFAEYIKQKQIKMNLPIIGEYSGHGVNVSMHAIKGDVVEFAAPVFTGIKYKFSKHIPDYVAEYEAHLPKSNIDKSVYSCQCLGDFLNGKLEGKVIKNLTGPVAFGEIAYQLVNHTMVYVSVFDM